MQKDREAIHGEIYLMAGDWCVAQRQMSVPTAQSSRDLTSRWSCLGTRLFLQSLPADVAVVAILLFCKSATTAVDASLPFVIGSWAAGDVIVPN